MRNKRIINAPEISEQDFKNKFLEFSETLNTWENLFFKKGFYTNGGDNSVSGFLPEKIESYNDRTIKEVYGMINLLELKAGHSILDVPCGAGRHIEQLEKFGIVVQGLDQNNDQISCASSSIQKKIKKGSMYKLPFPKNSFDAVSNMFFSFGFSEKPEENQKFLDECFRVLKKGGKFLIHTDVVIRENSSGDWEFPLWYKFREQRELENGDFLNIREWVYKNPNTFENIRLIGEWEISGVMVPYSMEIFSDKKYEKILKKSGFKNIKIYSNWKKNTLDFSKPQEMIIVGEK